jgi:hypothetical protein
MPARPNFVEASISAQNTFSSAIQIKPRLFNFTLTGTWVATPNLYRCFPGTRTGTDLTDFLAVAANWHSIASYTANIADQGTEAEENAWYRWGVPTSGYTSGTVVGRISQ